MIEASFAQDNDIICDRHTIPVLKDLTIKKLKDAIYLIEHDQSIRLADLYCSYAKTYLNCILERTDENER